MTLSALDSQGMLLLEETYFSIGGGFVVSLQEIQSGNDSIGSNVKQPYPFNSAEELLRIGRETGLTIAEIVLENEKVWRSETEVRAGIMKIWDAMHASIERGCRKEGFLPGGLNVKRRSKDLHRRLSCLLYTSPSPRDA